MEAWQLHSHVPFSCFIEGKACFIFTLCCLHYTFCSLALRRIFSRLLNSISGPVLQSYVRNKQQKDMFLQDYCPSWSCVQDFKGYKWCDFFQLQIQHGSCMFTRLNLFKDQMWSIILFLKMYSSAMSKGD